MTGDRDHVADTTLAMGGLARHVVVGVDGSRGSRAAVTWVARIACTTGARVLAVHVLTYDGELLRDVTLDTMSNRRRELESDLRTLWVGPLDGIDHRCLVVEADSPAAGLREVANRKHADLLVVGAHGHGISSDRVLGSVTNRVTRRARQPVIVVPADWAGS
jgi:nucleotide-binding universal stress UspA family protein